MDRNLLDMLTRLCSLVLLFVCASTGLHAQEVVPPPVTNLPNVEDASYPSYPITREAPRTVHEYGPVGHVRSRRDEGAATPALTPTKFTVTPEEAATRGSFPGSVKIPGTKTSLRIGGFIRGVGIFDFNPIGSNDDFDTTTIPIPREVGQNATFTARATRFEIESHTDSELFGDVKTYAELDFFESKDSTDFTSYRIRSRRLYFDVGWFRFGQDASVFTDYDSYPTVVDYEFPGSKLLLRPAQLRLTVPVSDQFKLAFSAEQPFTDMEVPLDGGGNPTGKTIQDLFDFASHMRYDNHYGHIQLGGLIRKLAFRPNGGDEVNDTGWGLAVTGDVHPWAVLRGESPTCPCPSTCTKSRIVGEYVAGNGIARYLGDPHGVNVDAALNSAGELEALFTRGWYAGYEHWWLPCWMSTFAYGENANSATDATPGDTYVGSKYAAVNVKWVPTKKFWWGMEYIWGERENQDQNAARARRISMGAQYNF